MQVVVDAVKASSTRASFTSKGGSSGRKSFSYVAEAVPIPHSIPIDEVGYDLRDRLSALAVSLDSDGDQKLGEKLVLVLLLSIACLAVVNLAVYNVVNGLVGHEWKLQPRNSHLDQGFETYRSIVKETVPFVRDWYHHASSDEPFLRSSSQRFQEDNVFVHAPSPVSNSSNCLEEWFSGLGDLASLVTVEETKLVLESMGLLDVPGIVRLLQPQLENNAKPNTHDMLSRSSTCLAQSETLSSMACAAMARYAGGLEWMHNSSSKTMVRRLVTRAVVLETLTSALMDDFVVLQDVIEQMEGNQRDLYADLIRKKLSPEVRDFHLQKYDGLSASLRDYLQSVASNQHRGLSSTSQLQVNILEAVKVDISKGFHDNARVGVALAAALSRGRTAVEPTYENHEMNWPLGQGWVEAYIAWNMAFVAGLQEEMPFFFQAFKLMIPSVACEMTTPHGAGFVARRLVSLTLFLTGYNEKALMQLLRGQDDITALGHFDDDLVQLFGSTNAKTLKLPSPSKETVDGMLFDLCGHGKACPGSWRFESTTSPASDLDQDQYRVFVGIVVFCTMMMIGVGLECFAIWSFLVGMTSWTNHTELKWRLAQFLFSLFALVSLGLAFSRNYLALLTTVVGLWKFGFPECLSYILVGLLEPDIGVVRRLSETLNGVGTILHHGAASLMIAMLLAGVLQPGRHISEPIFFLAMQHWFVMLRYVSFPAYVMIELALEVYFQWATIASLEVVFADHWSGGMAAGTMIFSHWLFVLSGALEILASATSAFCVNHRCQVTSQELNDFAYAQEVLPRP